MSSAALWWDGMPSPSSVPGRAPVAADLDVDVCIVGAGFTGLWTAYYLSGLAPQWSILVLDAEHVGFGASGRNGGWVSALWPVGPATIAAECGADAARSLVAALQDTVDEVGRVCAAESLDAGFVKGGTVVAARNAAQVARAQAEVAAAARWGMGSRWLDAAAARERLSATSLLGASYSPHCARVQPARLALGLAEAAERRGVVIAEGTRVSDVGAGVVRCASGHRVRARHVIRATEAWTARLPRLRRRIAPVYSLIVATEPLDAATWSAIGLAERETFSEHRHVIVYGQRSVDDRLVFGGRGAPYHLASGIRPEFDGDDAVFAALRATACELFPVLAQRSFTHAWGGPLGIARDWHPSVGYDPVSRVGWAGGYVGDGVAAANLAGRTLADLVTGRSTALTALPWVGHRSPAWEPEPFRWVGVNAGLRLAQLADREESVTGRPAVLGHLLSALTGH